MDETLLLCPISLQNFVNKSAQYVGYSHPQISMNVHWTPVVTMKNVSIRMDHFFVLVLLDMKKSMGLVLVRSELLPVMALKSSFISYHI